MKKVLLLAFVAIMIVGNATAQTIHVFNFCNTLDPNIGCEVDYVRTTQEAGLIAAFLNYDINYYNGEGEDCSNENLMNALNSLNCGKDDVILFYYSGHGTRSPQDKSEFPQMCLKYSGYEQDKFVAMYTVIEKLQAKGARFTLVMADCCNVASAGISAKSLMSKEGGAIVDDEMVASNYRKLFLENNGMVAVTSSKKGQYSQGGNTHGGVFSYAFFEIALYAACTGEIPATWDNVLGTVSSSIIEIEEPYYEINLNQNPSQPAAPAPPVPEQPVAPVIAVDASFANDLATLLDTSRSEDWRLNQANNLANKYFTADAKVATVGRNGKTIIEYESAREFLRRIAVSKLISKMNVIKEMTDSTGKRNYIKVQEIRKAR